VRSQGTTRSAGVEGERKRLKFIVSLPEGEKKRGRGEKSKITSLYLFASGFSLKKKKEKR